MKENLFRPLAGCVRGKPRRIEFRGCRSEPPRTGGIPNSPQTPTLQRSLAYDSSEVRKTAFFEKPGREDRILALNLFGTFSVFQALTIRPAGCHLDDGPLFQVDVFGRFHVEQSVWTKLHRDNTGVGAMCQLLRSGWLSRRR